MPRPPTSEPTRSGRAAVAAIALSTCGVGSVPPALAAEDAVPPITVNRTGSTPSMPGAPQSFTGRVRVDMLHIPTPPWRAASAAVTFEPGARTFWHTHPVGQTLIVTAGMGHVQRWGGPLETLRPGDVAWIPGGVKHWHGASTTTAMTHIAITETVDGRNVEWLEAVTDAQYPR